MNIWVCRAGKKGMYAEEFVEKEIISCTWSGYLESWGNHDKGGLVQIVMKVNGVNPKSTAAITWTNQMDIFVNKMKTGDLVIVPNLKKHFYMICMIQSEYMFEDASKDYLRHRRKVKWINLEIQKDCFSRELVNTLGAFRTVFQVKKNEQIEEIIRKVEGV